MTRHLATLLIMLMALLASGDDLAGQTGISAQIAPVPTTDPASFSASRNPGRGGYLYSDRLGITFINSAEAPISDMRYQQALGLGAGWTRWPLYWSRVETAPNIFNWAAYDELITADLRYGLRINAILLGQPSFRTDERGIIAGLNEPIFSDGSDVARPEKAINPNNPWANFVYQAVQRYKPGGALALAQGWRPGQGVALWEVWNEPDYLPFWRGGILNYARLLKVAYIAAHHADPGTTVMFGGLLYNTSENWLAQVLAIFQRDPRAADNNYYMDAVALHSYSYPWRTGWLTLYVRETLREYGIRRPIFVNETGVSVWDDYPGPTWTTSADQRLRLASAEQAAWFFIQSTAYAWAQGAEVVFFHQLYDDCGDQPAGSNFPPNNGELCATGTCFGDAFGLFRNGRDNICYSQHPLPNSARPAARAYRLMADIFSAHPFTGGTITRGQRLTTIQFDRPTTDERIRVIWNRAFEDVTIQIDAESDQARIHTLEGDILIQAQDGQYTLVLPAARPDNFPELEPGDLSAIGGPPRIIIERVSGGLAPRTTPAITVLPGEPGAETTPGSIVMPTPGPILPPPARPTTAPEFDRTPPVATVEPLPEISPATFEVRWRGEDDGGIDRYIIWVQVNDEPWQPWLETRRTEGFYVGTSGNTYHFAAWAVDMAGNWSTNTELVPQATTRVEG